MIISDIFESVLLERHLPVAQALLPYKDDPDAYITFVDHDKVGINPKSNYGTPLGVYAYPVQAMWTAIETDNIPFAGNRKFIYVLKAPNVLDLSQYNKSMWDADCQKLFKLFGAKLMPQLRNLYGSLDMDETEVWAEYAKDTVDATRGFFGGGSIMHGEEFWGFTRSIAAHIKEGQDRSLFYSPTWGAVIRSLGYQAFSDKKGLGIIHRNEPKQAVFFTGTAFRVVEKVYNTKKRIVDRTPRADDDKSVIHSLEDLFAEYDSRSIRTEIMDLLLDGKSEHYVSAIDMTKLTGDDIYHLIYECIHKTPGTISKLIKLVEKYPNLLCQQIVDGIVHTANVAKLTREDISMMLSPKTMVMIKDSGFVDADFKPTKMADGIVSSTARKLRASRQDSKSKMYRKPVKPSDVLAMIGPGAKMISRLLTPERIATLCA